MPLVTAVIFLLAVSCILAGTIMDVEERWKRTHPESHLDPRGFEEHHDEDDKYIGLDGRLAEIGDTFCTGLSWLSSRA